jgi:predicted NACHT family NTPase
MGWLILLNLNLPLTPPSPTQTPTIDPTVLASIIGAAVALIAAVISAAVAIYQTRRNAKLEKEKNDSQIAAQNAQLTAQLEIEREKIRLQHQLDALQADQERQRQRQEMDDEAARIAVEQAKTKQERIHAYRNAICADPRIAQLQILDMSHPLDVDHIFVRVRLHRETKTPYEIDPLLLEAEASCDPNALLKAHRKYLETCTSAALDPEDAIRTYKRCVLVGDPGAGKTTLLKYLALKAARQQLNALPDFPIHIELNAFAASRYSDILEFISTRWDDRYGFPKAEARACIEERLQAGTALLLLDALDETAIGDSLEEAEASYERITDAINQLVSRYHQSSIVVTVRKASYQQHTHLPGFTELEVLDFRPEDIEQFIDSWFVHANKSNKPIDANDLKNKLARNTRLQSLAANPLLLCLIVIVYEDQLDLPDRRAELYKLCVDILLTKWDTSRGIKRLREFKSEYKRGLLQEIAWHFHNLGQRYIPECDLLNVIANFLPVVGLQCEQNLRVLEEITSENGLLKEQARH